MPGRHLRQQHRFFQGENPVGKRFESVCASPTCPTLWPPAMPQLVGHRYRARHFKTRGRWLQNRLPRIYYIQSVYLQCTLRVKDVVSVLEMPVAGAPRRCCADPIEHRSEQENGELPKGVKVDTRCGSSLPCGWPPLLRPVGDRDTPRRIVRVLGHPRTEPRLFFGNR